MNAPPDAGRLQGHAPAPDSRAGGAVNSPAHPATSGDLYRSLFQAANDIMLLAGQDSRIVDVNEQAVKTYG